jgi:hypothetical protein
MEHDDRVTVVSGAENIASATVIVEMQKINHPVPRLRALDRKG